MTIEVSSALVEALLAEAESAFPQEACGLLLGEGARIESLRPATNVHPDPARHFEIDPRALIDAHRAARSDGPQVLGHYHSHPIGPPEPSAADRTQATGDGQVWAIAGEGSIGWWRDALEGFEALSYTVQDS